MAVVTTRATAIYACSKCRKVGNGKWLRFHTYDAHGESIVGQFSLMCELLYEISIYAGPTTWVWGDPVRWSALRESEEH